MLTRREVRSFRCILYGKRVACNLRTHGPIAGLGPLQLSRNLRWAIYTPWGALKRILRATLLRAGQAVRCRAACQAPPAGSTGHASKKHGPCLACRRNTQTDVLVSCRKQPFSCRAVPAHEHVPGVLNTGQPVRAGQQFLRLGLRGTRKPTMGTRERARKPCLRAARARNFHLPVRRPPARGAGVEGAGRQPRRGGTTNATAVVGGSASEPLRPRPVFWEPDGNRPAVLGQRSRFSTTTMRASGWNSTLGKRTCSCS